ncbi:MAG: hypothetical protein QM820_01380 [Minicystis sp.]
MEHGRREDAEDGLRGAGNFVVKDVIATGRDHVLYRAMRRGDGQPAVLQVFPGCDEVAARRVLSAVRPLIGLSHPAVQRVIDARVVDGRVLSVAVAPVEGETLAARIERSGRLGIGEVVALATGAAAALAAIHRRGGAHGNLRPHNVVLSPDLGGAPVLTEVGLGELFLGAALDTAPYTSPEQLTGAEPDARSDVYALAATLHAAIGGAPPFSGKSVVVLLQHVLGSPPARLADRIPEVPAAIDAELQRALAKDPADRHPDPTTLARALVRACDLRARVH